MAPVGIPVPMIVEPTTKPIVVTFVIVVFDVVTFPVKSINLAGERVVVVMFEIEIEHCLLLGAYHKT